MSDKETIEKLTQEVISLRKQVDSLTPKLYHIKAWHKFISNGGRDGEKKGEIVERVFIDRTYKCYSRAQAEYFLDSFASKSSWGGQSIFTSVEQVDFTPVENDWINQLGKKLLNIG